jgi:putative FmdB family regulatory protein
MPLYDFKCSYCEYTDEHVAHIDENSYCPNCGELLERQFPCTHGINMGASGAYGYFDDNLNCYIETNSQRKREMRKQGVSERFGKGWY